ncbi:unnamed protein product [Lasius platythorax]
MKNNNRHLAEVFNELIEAMKRQSPLFSKTFQRIVYVGSYFKKTRVGEPEEYDLNFVINLPFKERDMEFISDCPGFIKIRTTWRDRDMSFNTLNLEREALKELESFIDHESYLNQDKFRTWMEGILSKVAYESSKSNQIKLSDHILITVKKAGPAFTLKISGKRIDIDVVPVLAFSTRNLPPKCSNKEFLEGCKSPDSRYWSVVPKPLNNSANFNDSTYRYWRLCFYEFEKDILAEHGRTKPIIRLLKKLRDTQNWNNIASYYIETLCLNELDTFWILKRKSFTFLFFTMLQKLREAFRKGSITYFWDEDLNLLENIGWFEMKCMEGRIDRIIKKIEKTIEINKYAIAEWILNEDELNHLQFIDRASSDRSILYESSESESSESEPEPANQWRCVIV